MADFTKDSLPMEVREHLMRGQWDAAIQILVDNHSLAESDAKALIRNYRKALKDRNVELEVLKMQNTYSKEAEQAAQQKKVTLIRTVFALIVLAMIILLLSVIKI